MMPWIPPMRFVSMVGHAIFHTAGDSGPSTMDRSYRRRSGAAGGAMGAAAAAAAATFAGAGESTIGDAGADDWGPFIRTSIYTTLRADQRQAGSPSPAVATTGFTAFTPIPHCTADRRSDTTIAVQPFPAALSTRDLSATPGGNFHERALVLPV